MDLSFLKWPVIGIVVVGGCWLLSSGGVNFMYKQFTAEVPGMSQTKDEANEAGLSKLAGYSMAIFQYERAQHIYNEALNRFPNGKNHWWNIYQLARCEEKLEHYQASVDLLRKLIAGDAVTHDDRVSNNDALRLRIEKLVEMYDLK